MRKWMNGCLAAAVLLGSLTLPISGNRVYAAEASAQDLYFEQANYGALIASGLVENPVLKTVGRGGGPTYYEYSRSIQADAAIPAPNDMGKAAYYLVVEATTSVSTDYGNATTSSNRQISVSSDGEHYNQLWQPENNGQAQVVGSPGTRTEYWVIKINGEATWPREVNAQGDEVEYRTLYTNMQKVRMNWTWNGPYSESMKSIKYRVYRKELPRQTDAPGITVNPSEDYHKGLNNTFSLSKPGYYANSGEKDSGILQYRLNGGSWNNYQEGSQVSITTEGEVKIESRLLTGGSIESLYGTAYSRQDNTPPTAPQIMNIDSNKWYTSGVPVIIHAGTDAGSGPANIRYRFSGATEQPEGYLSGTPMIANEGVTQITARTVDHVGLYSDEATAQVHIDRTPPAAVLTAPQEWANSVMISASGTDAVSGMHKIVLPNGSSYRGNSAKFQATANGTYTFGFFDVAGNSVEKSIAVSNIDDVNPVVSVSQNGAAWTGQDVPVHFTFADGQSGLNMNKLYYKVTNSPDTPDAWNPATAEETITLQQEGIWYLHLQGEDLAGNPVHFVSKPYHLQKQPATPQLQVVGTDTDEMLLKWSLPAGSAETDGYTYEVTNENTGKTWNVPYPAHELRDSSLQPGEKYRYVIVAKNHVGESIASQAVTGVTLPVAPLQASVYPKDRDYSTALISVDPVKSATGYRIVATNWGTQQVDADVTVTGDTYQDVPGLHPYAMYDFAISALNESGEGIPYHISYLSLPNQVSGFTSVQIKEDAIHLNWHTATRDTYSWSSVSEDTYYQLERNQTRIFEGLITEYEDTHLDPGKSYDYAVAAGNSSGFGTKAVLSNIWTLPAAVKQLQQKEASADRFTLSWVAPAGVTGYRAVVDDTYVIDIPERVNQYTFDGLAPGTTHAVVLSPRNPSGYGQAVSALGTTLPDIPVAGALEVKHVGEDQVTFLIHGVPGADKYRLQINHEEYVVGAGELTVSGLQGGTWYDYSFAGGNTAGYGQAAVERVLTLPAAVTGYEVGKHTPTSLVLSWQPVKGAKSYEIYTPDEELLATVTQETYRITSLQPGSSNRWMVRAVNESGAGQTSSFSWRTLPGFENEDELDWSSLVKVTHTGVHAADLSWPAVPGADRYRIYDQDHQVVGESAEPHITLSELDSAQAYSKYIVVPYNSTGEGKPMTVPTFVTKPSPDYTATYTSSRSEVSLDLQHQLDHEILVIASQGKELYRGPVKDYHAYKQDRLQPSSIYTFEIWTENEAGDRSPVVELETRTKKERETVIEQKADTPIDIETPAEPVEADLAPEVSQDNDKKDRKNFIDINRSFAKDSITRLADMGIVKGISDDLYAPKAGTTRAEFMSMLTRLAVPADQIQAAADEQLTFTDTPADRWYTPELKAAIRYGIAKGFSAEDFRPDQEIDREQAAKMLSGALYSLVAETDQMNYADASDVSVWARPEVSGLTATEIVEGYPDQTFRPHANLTRAESAAMIDRALQRGMINEPVQ
ncbi:fibronectin type III domain-containing protein [Paenibacillus bovis]|uniref:S-layer domain-containing protein n=1 Tax=Paenibacillus bovis TaxID=1616788 RepID=A0A1X9T486_9BACL|nr:S-layer homology domain-containing protein [Paenibacillus bovis]ARR10748.1 S-layer domain-containing protein [Paenibacillus bovis]